MALAQEAEIAFPALKTSGGSRFCGKVE